MITVGLPESEKAHLFSNLTNEEKSEIIEYGFIVKELLSSILDGNTNAVLHSNTARSIALKEFMEQGISTAVETATADLQCRLSTADKRYESLHERYLSMCENFNREIDMKTAPLLRRIDDLRQQEIEDKCRASNSSVKGRNAEDEVMGCVSSMFPKAELEDCRSEPHRGDIIWKDGDISMMIEIKDYVRNVQKSEIDKFQSDMLEPSNSDIKCGVMLSLRSGVCRRSHFELEVWNGKPVLFLHNWNACQESLLVVVAFFKMVLSQDLLSLDLQEKLSRFSHTISSLRKIVVKRKRRIEKFYKDELALVAEELDLVAGLSTSISTD